MRNAFLTYVGNATGSGIPLPIRSGEALRFEMSAGQARSEWAYHWGERDPVDGWFVARATTLKDQDPTARPGYEGDQALGQGSRFRQLADHYREGHTHGKTGVDPGIARFISRLNADGFWRGRFYRWDILLPLMVAAEGTAGDELLYARSQLASRWLASESERWAAEGGREHLQRDLHLRWAAERSAVHLAKAIASAFLPGNRAAEDLALRIKEGVESNLLPEERRQRAWETCGSALDFAVEVLSAELTPKGTVMDVAVYRDGRVLLHTEDGWRPVLDEAFGELAPRPDAGVNAFVTHIPPGHRLYARRGQLEQLAGALVSDGLIGPPPLIF